MRYKLRLLLETSAIFCLVLSQVAVAGSVPLAGDYTDHYRSVINVDDPCLYITFDEVNGLVRHVPNAPDDVNTDVNFVSLKDYSGHNYWVAANPMVMIVEAPGSMGKAALLNGDNGRSWIAAANQLSMPSKGPAPDYVHYGHKYAFTGPGCPGCPQGVASSITIEFWLRNVTPFEWNVDSYACFLDQADDFDNSGGHPDSPDGGDTFYAPAMGRANRDANSVSGNQQFRVRNGIDPVMAGADGYSYSARGTFPTDGWWHHVVVEYNEHSHTGTSDDPYMGVQMYLDANLIINADVNTDPCGTNTGRGTAGPETDHILIGNTGNHWSTGSDAYSGYIDEFAIYQGLLSPARIRAHYNAFQPQSCAEMRQRDWGQSVGPVTFSIQQSSTTKKATWWLEYDLNHNCQADFVDLADFVSEWLFCNDPCDPTYTPNWK